MPRQIRLTFVSEGVSAVAELLEDAAPQICAAVWKALPSAGEVQHAIYSGSECVLVLPEKLRAGPENATSDVQPGDVGFIWFAPGASCAVEEEFAEICWFYDRDARPSMPEGPVPVSLFARIREGAEAFYAVCRRMRREGAKPFAIERAEAGGGISPGMKEDLPFYIRLIADRFVRWQAPYGWPDPERCPFVTRGPCISTHFHSPTFMAIGLYRAFDATGLQNYRDAADRYVAFYLSCMRNPPAGGQRQDYPSYPYQYGMALAGYAEFRRHHPDETSLDGKAAALYEWLLLWRWPEGSYFRNSYGSPAHGAADCANSDDNCHMGRGLMGYYAVSGRADVLRDAEGLARYYLAEAKAGSFDGCWSSLLGTWVVAPTLVDGFEHFRGKRACEMGWGFSSTGAIEFLCQLGMATHAAELKSRIADKCARSMQWQFDACQFDDGACGMCGRDDKWIGMTSGAILSYLRVRQAGFLSEETAARYRSRALAARDWLLANLTPEAVDAGGYFRATGDSEPRPPENQAWMLGWTLDALTRLPEI